MCEFEIREATADDAERMLAYMKAIGGETFNLSFGADGMAVTVEQERAFLQSVLDDITSTHLIACKDGEIIGDGSLSALSRRMSHRAELGLAVRKAYWNKGVGGALTKKLIEYAKKNGTELINLEVRRDNSAAIHLYKKLGFKSIGVSPAFFKIDGEYFDFELMYLDLRQAD